MAARTIIYDNTRGNRKFGSESHSSHVNQKRSKKPKYYISNLTKLSYFDVINSTLFFPIFRLITEQTTKLSPYLPVIWFK